MSHSLPIRASFWFQFGNHHPPGWRDVQQIETSKLDYSANFCRWVQLDTGEAWKKVLTSLQHIKLFLNISKASNGWLLIIFWSFRGELLSCDYETDLGAVHNFEREVDLEFRPPFLDNRRFILPNFDVKELTLSQSI